MTHIEGIIARVLGWNPEALKFTRVSDCPQNNQWKHACLKKGIVMIKGSSINIETKVVYFMACPDCGKITYFVEDY